MGRPGRVWFGTIAVLAVAALVTQVVLVVMGDDGGLAARLVRLFSYFTVLSNVLVAVVAGLLARARPVPPAAHLASVLSIAVTGVIHYVVLRPITDPQGIDLVVDSVFHVVVPVLHVAGWAVLGPHGRWSVRALLVALLYPTVYLAWTVLRGAVVGEYPYPFVDVVALGYAGALRNAVAVTAVFAVLGALLLAADRALVTRRRTAVSS